MSRPQSRSKVNLGRGACPVVKMAKGGVVKMKKGVKFARKVKHGQNALLIHIQALMQTLLQVNIAKIQTMLKRQKAEKERVANGRT